MKKTRFSSESVPLLMPGHPFRLRTTDRYSVQHSCISPIQRYSFSLRRHSHTTKATQAMVSDSPAVST